MNRTRALITAALGALTLGSLAATGGWAWYLRSDAYRAECSAELSDSLGMPAEIGRVVPRSLHSREFQDITVWLPGRRARVHHCDRAILSYDPGAASPDAYEIDLLGGSSEISTRTWLRQDYRRVVESGLKTGFSERGPTLVRFKDMSLDFERAQFRARLSRAAGTIDFTNPRHAEARVTCDEFNGFACPEPVRLSADFSESATGMQVDRLELRVPDLPLKILRLEDLAGVHVEDGRFDGVLRYEEPAGVKRVIVAGHCRGLDLGQLTTGLLAHPWAGRCPEIELQELRVENRVPIRLRFRGSLADVSLGDLLANWGIEGARGVIALQVGEADISRESIHKLVASGSCVDVDLEALSAAIGRGRLSGTLRVTIEDLTIVENRLVSFAATLAVADAPADQPNWIEGVLLRELVRDAIRIELPPILPARIEYTQLGLRIEIHDELLTVFGTHGDRGKTILTVRLFGKNLPLVFEPANSFDLKPWFDDLRRRLADLRDRIGPPAPTTGPATEPARTNVPSSTQP